MGVVNSEDVRGYLFENGELVCAECYHTGTDDRGSRPKILTADDMEDEKVYICDQCEKEIAK